MPSPFGVPGEGSECRWLRVEAAHIAAAAVTPPADMAQVYLPAPAIATLPGCSLQHLPWLEMTSWPGFLHRVYSAFKNVFLSAKVMHRSLKCVRGGGGVALSAARNPVQTNMLEKKQSVGWFPVKFPSGGTVIC